MQDTIPISTNAYTFEELNTSINTLVNNKAPGIDEIPAEVQKSGSLNDQLLDGCNMMLEGSGKFELCSKSIINPVTKKGDPSEPHNKRGIALIQTAAKIYNRVLRNRIRPY